MGIEGENGSIATTTVNMKDECYESLKVSLTLFGLHEDEVVEFQEVFFLLTLYQSNQITL